MERVQRVAPRQTWRPGSLRRRRRQLGWRIRIGRLLRRLSVGWSDRRWNRIGGDELRRDVDHRPLHVGDGLPQLRGEGAFVGKLAGERQAGGVVGARLERAGEHTAVAQVGDGDALGREPRD